LLAALSSKRRKLMPLSVRVKWWPRLNCMALGRLFPPHYDAAGQTVANPPYALPQAEVHARGSMSNLQGLGSIERLIWCT
jgi:hypothetical protein